MTRQKNSRPRTAKAERLSKALRDNLKRRKAQTRGRGVAKAASEEDQPRPPKKT